MKQRSLIFFALLLLQACNYNHTHGDPMATSGTDSAQMKMTASLDFNNVQASVIGPQCLQCHSSLGGSKGGLNLETYQQVKSAMSSIYFRSVEKKDMPPRDSLSPVQFDLLKSWLEAGGPEKSMGRGTGREIKGPITWLVVRDQIFKNSCLDCHSGSKPDAALDLASLEATKKNIEKIFKTAIIDNSMPVDPYPSMSTFEKQALMKWISQGMPE